MKLGDVDRALAAADPVDERQVDGFGMAASEKELLAAILADPPAAGASAKRPRKRPLPTGRRLAAGLAISALAAVGLILALSGGPGASPDSTAYGARLIRFAESTPLVLIGEPGWRVGGIQPTRFEGEMEFARGEAPIPRAREAELNWYGPLDGQPGYETLDQVFRSRVDDRAASAEVQTTAPVLGTTAQVFQYMGGEPGARDITSLWVEDGWVMEFRSLVPDLDAFRERLGSLKKVDPETWLDAMPPSVVRAADQPLAVEEMLRGIPLPPGFEAADVSTEGLTTDRYQLGAAVAGSVACTWFARWADGRREGDEAKVREATEAMSDVRGWPLMREMSGTGAYPQILASLGDAMPSGHVYKQRPLASDFEMALGCSRLLGIEIPQG